MKTADTGPNNLPAPLTSFIGREREIAEVRRLLVGTRLLTLTGAGGCGKSRLALEVAASLLAEFPDGVWVVELAARSDAHLVPQAVSAALHVPEQPARAPGDALIENLRSKSLLLVLDNCEHLLGACAQLTEGLLRACPRLRVLATSREALGVAGETIVRVPPLSLPDPAHLPPPDQLTRYEAARLFVERAAAAQPEFRVTVGNAPAIAQVCGRLDGMPLAIELAAARVKVLTAEQIASRLDDRFRLLTGGHRTMLPQHRTLRAAMDWSYDLLSDKERALLPRLSVFAGGWTLEAAEAVCAGDEIAASDVLDLLAQLADKSLVIVETRGAAARYRLLETVRQYARDRLEEAGEADALHGRHRDYYLELAERAAPQMWGSVQRTWVERLEAEHDNLRDALGRCRVEEDGAEAELRLAAALMWFWFIHGEIKEGLGYLEGALAREQTASPSARARAMCGAGVLAWRYDEYDHASMRLQESLTLFRTLGDTRGIAFTLHFTAHVDEARGRLSEAAAQFEQSLAYYRRTNDTWGIGKSLSCLGSAVLRQGDYGRAEALIEQGLPFLRQAGDQTHTASALARLAFLAQARGDGPGAKALAEEGLRMVREAGETSYGAGARITLGLVAIRSGDPASATPALREALALNRRIGDRETMSRSLGALAEAAMSQRQPERAARLFGAEESLRESIKNPLPPGERADREVHLAALRGTLGDKAWAREWAAGKRMSADEAYAFALAGSPEDAPDAAPQRGTAPVGTGAPPLTSREREVATLIARGLTNREIAARLVIAERTAEGHVQSILNKLGFNSRAQIAAWTVANGIQIAGAG